MNIVIDILLALACLSVAVTAVGVLISRDTYQRLHFLAPSAAIGAVCVTVAILLKEAWSQIGVKTAIAALVIFLMNPVLTHATARAARIHEHCETPEREGE